jgi:putative oxidoreductase
MVRSDDWALLLGRIAVGLLFVPSGFGKLMNFSGFAASLAAKGVPFAELFAAAAVAAELGGGLLVILGFQIRWVSLVMLVFTAVAAALSHRFWEFDGAARQAQEIQFFKNLAIIGGFLFLHVAGAGAFSLDAMRRRPAGVRIA